VNRIFFGYWHLLRRFHERSPAPILPNGLRNAHRRRQDVEPRIRLLEFDVLKALPAKHVSPSRKGSDRHYPSAQRAEHTVESEPPVKDYYLNENQLIPQCSHCHKVRCHGADVKWDWGTEWVASPPEEVTHSLCEPCADYYYGELKPTLTSP